MISFTIIKYNSPEYQEMVELRNRILRKPLGLVLTEEERIKDEVDFLLVASFQPKNRIVACCVLTPVNEYTVQLRQVAVDTYYQNKGVGGDLLRYAEQIAVENDFKYLYLHARETAVDFYKKVGFQIEGDQFIEVGIPHFEMLKILNK